MPPVGDTDGGTPTIPGRTPTIRIPGKPRPADHGDADADAGVDADAAAPAPATSAPLAAGRHAATYELECFRLRQKVDAQRNTIKNLAAEVVDLDKKTVRALCDRDHVQEEAAAQLEGASASAGEARGDYETNLK
eukprot:6178306-Pleurochrysis_carterae.AAC.10